MIDYFLNFVKKWFFNKKDLPIYNPDDLKQANKLIQIINQERKSSGLMPLEEMHELNEVAIENAKFYFQYDTVNMKPDNIVLEFRLLKKEITPAACGELANSGAETPEECFFSWLVRNESAGVLKNGHFTHVGVGKCEDYWSAVFARPRII